MTLVRARVIRSDDARGVTVVTPLVLPRHRVLSGAVAEASLEAARRLDAAEREAAEVVASARRAAEALRQQAHGDARAAAEADLAAAWVALRGEDARSDERAFERTVELARAMAERLLGEALAIDPARIVAIARSALVAARSARRVAIRAHPIDAQALSAQLVALDLEGPSVQIHADEAQSRGSLYFETDLGSLDARLTLQLDRLTSSLREARRASR